MRQMKRLRALSVGRVVLAGCAAMVTANVTADAQSPDLREVYLVRQDFSDCANSNVPNVDSPAVGGAVWITRQSDGNTTLKIALTASPDTTYHFYLKCVRQLGDVVTGDEGVGEASFTFPTNAVGNVYAFDSYPEGAPAGNKFQSAQVKFQ